MDKKKEKEVERGQRKIDFEKQQTEEAINIRIFSLRSRWENTSYIRFSVTRESNGGFHASTHFRPERNFLRKIFTAKKFEFLGN